MAISRFSTSSVAQGLPKYQKVWDQATMIYPNISKAFIYSSFNGGLRSSNYSVQYSSNGTSWTTAFTGVASNNGNQCGVIQNTGGGSDYGRYRYWRYVCGSGVTGHHPRVARITLQDVSGNNYNIKVYVSDNCADSGGIPADGEAFTYDFFTNTAS